MQQTKSYWRLVAAAGVVSAFIASACVVTTSTDDDSTAGSGGSGNAGAGTAGAPTAGSATAGSNTAGAATAGAPTGGSGSTPFQCDPPGEGGAVGTPLSCAPQDPPGNDCEKCIQAKCCEEYSACYAYDPGNQCGWGGPAKLPNGDEYGGGEALCIQLCIQDGVAMSGTAPDAELEGACAANCTTTTATGGAHECGSTIGLQTDDLIRCINTSCQKVCFGPLD